MYLKSEISKINNANEVFEALARGFSKYSDLLSQSHVSSSPALADVLEKLIRMEVVKKEAPINDVNNKRKAGYIITDNLSLFYYRYVFRYSSQMNVMDSDVFYDRYIGDDFERQYVPRQFEEICRQYLIRQNRAVNDLYELLTFNEVMQDISIKDTEIMDNMKAAKSGLEADKVELEAQRKELQSQKAELDTQNYQMKAKQSELNSSISAAQLSAQDAQKAQQTAQAAIESDELNYEAVKKEIQKLIAAAASSKPQLSFTGFACPLKSYTRISSEYGWRKNPVSGVNRLHAGIDLAAPGGTPIYAAASGYVQVAGWSSGGYGNYVIIYHGSMSDGNAYSTLYGHMRSVATSAGKYVKQGELIGYVGSTGNSTGNHLHLEVWKGGKKANAVNPRGYIPFPHN